MRGLCKGCFGSIFYTESWRKLCPVCFKRDRGWKITDWDLEYQRLSDSETEQRMEILALRKQLVDARHDNYLLRTGASPGAPADPTDGIPVMDLIKLCHPDKHGDSAVAKRVTQALLARRARA